MNRAGKRTVKASVNTLAEKAMLAAVEKVILAHRESGLPLAVWRDGKVVYVQPDQVGVREMPARYRKRARSR